MKNFIFQKVFLVLFGIFLTIIMLEIGLRLGGFVILSIQDYRNEQALKRCGTYKIMCIGESTTQDQWPRFLENALWMHDLSMQFSVVDKGLTGANTSFVLAQLESNIKKYSPDMVISMIGVNDSGDHLPVEFLTIFKNKSFLSSLRVYKLARLMWLHIVAKAKEIKASDKINVKSECSLSEEGIREKISINPRDDNAYVELACVYETQERIDLAKEAFKKAISINPRNMWAYIRLGWISGDEEYKRLRFGVAGVLSKALAVNSADSDAKLDYLLLAEIVINQGYFDEGEKICKEVIEADPVSYQALILLGKAYLYQNRYLDAETILKKAIDLNNSSSRAYDYLSVLYHEIANTSLEQVYYEKASKCRPPYYTLETVNNYKQIKKILDAKKIKLVAVQYPMRSVTPLKNIFEDSRNIVFVDNEHIFKNALKNIGYRELFFDMFAGDFGHCTDKGNKLLAGNIANVIVKEVFYKRIKK